MNARTGMLGAAVSGTLLALATPALGVTPPGLSPDVGDEVHLHGRLEVLHSDDLAHGQSAHAYALREESGRVTTLTFADGGPHELGGQVVDVQGVQRRGSVYVASDSYVETDGTAGTSTTTPSGPGIVRFGVILVNFSDKALDESVDPRRVQSLIFGDSTSAPSVDAFYDDNSFGSMDMPVTHPANGTGPVYGPVTISATKTDPCDKEAWGVLARAEAATFGYDDTAFTHVAHILPKTTCAWHGSSQLPGKYTWDVVDGVLPGDRVAERRFQGLVAHELGHNLNAWHGASWACTDNRRRPVVLGSRCTLDHYGDPFTVMGTPWEVRTFNGFQKSRVSWYATDPGQNRLTWIEQQSAVVTQTSTGQVTLAPIDKQAPRDVYGNPVPQVFRVPVPGSTTDFYYVETRGGHGFDGASDGREAVTGATIRIAPHWTTPAVTKLLDMTPESEFGFADAQLIEGKSFVDNSGVTITNSKFDETTGLTTFDVKIVTHTKRK